MSKMLTSFKAGLPPCTPPPLSTFSHAGQPTVGVMDTLRKKLIKMDEEHSDLEDAEIERRTIERPELFDGLSFGLDAALTGAEQTETKVHVEFAGGRITEAKVAGTRSSGHCLIASRLSRGCCRHCRVSNH